MNNNLKSKKVLFIGPKTFNYEKEIIKCLEGMGATVDYFNDRPFESSIKKILLRLAPKLLKNEVGDYFHSILNKTQSQDYDYVFCIKLECFPHNMLEELKLQQLNAKFIFYTWDSFSNNTNALKCLSIFDTKLTFDSKDAKLYELKHRPLFYLNEYSEISVEPIKYDISFIGSVHMQRYLLIKQFLKNVDSKYNNYMYLFVPSKLLFWVRKILLFPIYGSSKLSDFKFLPLSQKEIISIFARSKAIVDICHHNQSGLTMRTIEALGGNRKLITNNVNIKKYDFFNPQNILIIDKNNINVTSEFLTNDYVAIDPKVLARYSIDGWVKEVFNV